MSACGWSLEEGDVRDVKCENSTWKFFFLCQLLYFTLTRGKHVTNWNYLIHQWHRTWEHLLTISWVLTLTLLAQFPLRQTGDRCNERIMCQQLYVKTLGHECTERVYSRLKHFDILSGCLLYSSRGPHKLTLKIHYCQWKPVSTISVTPVVQSKPKMTHIIYSNSLIKQEERLNHGQTDDQQTHGQ